MNIHVDERNYSPTHRALHPRVLRPPLRLPETGYLTSAEAAQRLGVSQSTVQKWYRLGLLPGNHDGGSATLWIRWTEDLGQRLLGGATPDPRMVSIRTLGQTQGQKPEALLVVWMIDGYSVKGMKKPALGGL